MAGSLSHGKSFRKISYCGNDTRMHYELEPVLGGMNVVSRSSWDEALSLFRQLGMECSEWPEYPMNIDLPLEDIQSRNEMIAARMSDVVVPDDDEYYWVRKIAKYVNEGCIVFYCRE